MKKENILEVIEKELEKQLNEIDFAIDWDTKKHQFEVILVLFAENKEQEAIEDEEGILSEEAVIEFEDTVLFYTNESAVVDKDDYLATIHFDRKKGLSREWIHTFATYLNEIITEGQSDLLDFLTDETIESFELKWNQADFNQRVEAIEKNTFVSYPKY